MIAEKSSSLTYLKVRYAASGNPSLESAPLIFLSVKFLQFYMKLRTASAAIQADRDSSRAVERVYTIIKQRSGRVTSKEIEAKIGSAQLTRKAITRLTLQGKIKRIKGFGFDRVEYFYLDLLQDANPGQ